MADINNLITNNLDVWTSAIKKKSATGRGSNSKIELTGIKKLRELILELAVRGKLIPQDDNDEPASVLLKRVEEEREALVASNQIKKQKPLPQLNIDDVNFDLPSGWAIAYIPEVVSYDKYAIKRGPFGSALKKAYFVAEGIKIYEQQHAIKDDFSLGEYYITEEKFKELSAFEVKPNDLIISCSGTVGKVAIAPKWMKKGIINQALLKITLNESALTNAYFKILFPAFYMQTETLSDLQGTAQKNMVSVDTLKKEPFPLPSLAEQHRIVAKVDELMALCDELEQQTEQSLTAHQTLVEVLLATLTVSKSADDFQSNWQRISQHFDVLFTTEHSIEQLKQTILQLAVMGKLVPQNPNDEPASKLLEKIAEEKAQLIKDKKIPKAKKLSGIEFEDKSFHTPVGWNWVRFDPLFNIIVDCPHSTAKFQDTGLLCLDTNSFKQGELHTHKFRYVSQETFDQRNARLIPKPRDIVFAREGSVGESVVIPKGVDCCLGQRVMLFRPSNHLNSEFLRLTMSNKGALNLLLSMHKGIGAKHVNVRDMRAFPICLPPAKEQHRIVVKVDELMALCDQLKTRLADAQTTQLHLTDAIVEQALN